MDNNAHPPRSATGEREASALGQGSWALFEFARSPYLSLIYIYVFGPYFATVIIGDAARGQELWSLANTLVGFVVAAMAPVLGAISDRGGARKPWLATIVVVMAAGCVSLWWATPPGQSGLSVSAILAILIMLAGCFLLSEVFHNAMLPSIVRQERIGQLSGIGIATNNLGSLIALIIMLFGVALPASHAVDWSFLPDQPLFGLDPDKQEHNRIVGPVAGVWLLLFSLPLFVWTPDRASTRVPPMAAIRAGFAQLGETIKRARRIGNVLRYLIARMLYNDGKVAALAYIGIYGAGVFGWGMPQLLMCALILSPFAIVGGFLGGWLDDTFGSKRAILISISVSVLAILFGVAMTPDRLFFVVPYDAQTTGPLWAFPYFHDLPEMLYLLANMVLAISITSAFTNSRTMMARIAPINMLDQFFGLYALSGTATAFLGHAMVGVFTRVFDSQRAGFASLVILLVLGMALMTRVREERAEPV